MSGNNLDNHYTEEEKEANARVDAWAMFSGLMIVLAVLIFFVATK